MQIKLKEDAQETHRGHCSALQQTGGAGLCSVGEASSGATLPVKVGAGAGEHLLFSQLCAAQHHGFKILDARPPTIGLQLH